MKSVFRNLTVVLLAAVLALCASRTACAGEDALLNKRAVKAARSGDLDFAFMNYRSILLRYPRSPFAQQALFAKGEYYYSLPDFPQARLVFEEYVKKYPESEAKMFALVYLMKIALADQDQATADELSRELINLKQVSLVFRDFKEYSFLSPMNNQYRAVFHIDKIEIFLNGEPFAEISY